MGLGTILLIVLVLLLIGAIPSWPHSRNWGYGPSGGLGLVVVVLVVLLLTGRIEQRASADKPASSGGRVVRARRVRRVCGRRRSHLEPGHRALIADHRLVAVGGRWASHVSVRRIGQGAGQIGRHVGDPWG